MTNHKGNVHLFMIVKQFYYKILLIYKITNIKTFSNNVRANWNKYFISISLNQSFNNKVHYNYAYLKQNHTVHAHLNLILKMRHNKLL